jgi:hypothetical protein
MLRIAKFNLAALGLLLALSACNSHSPTSRAVGGGLLGGAAGAGIAGVAGGDMATGALLGAGVGALGGALTTPDQGRHRGHRNRF